MKPISRQMAILPFNLGFRTVKILDLGYITVIQFLTAIIAAGVFDKLYGKFNTEEADARSFGSLTFEIVIHLWLIGIVIYIMRNLSEVIPSPLHGVAGLNHFIIKELTSTAIFSVVIISFQENLNDKINYYKDRFILGKSSP